MSTYELLGLTNPAEDKMDSISLLFDDPSEKTKTESQIKKQYASYIFTSLQTIEIDYFVLHKIVILNLVVHDDIICKYTEHSTLFVQVVLDPPRIKSKTITGNLKY